MNDHETFFIEPDRERHTIAAELRAASGRLVSVWRQVRAPRRGARMSAARVHRYSPVERGGPECRAGISAARLALMCCELRLLLDRHANARQVLHHLAFLERGLDHNAERMLTELPPPFLRKALAQLEGLVADWRPRGLAELRSRLATRLAEHEHRLQRGTRS